MKPALYIFVIIFILFVGCEKTHEVVGTPEPDLREEYYAGGLNGTAFISTSGAFEQPAPAVNDIAAFRRGEKIFETGFVSGNDGPFSGLGPAYIRRSCISCHPGYGRAKRVETFNPEERGNGYLVFVHHPDGSIVKGFTTMLQTSAVAPYVPPVSGVNLTWNNYTDQHNNRYPDGTPYNAGTDREGSLIYPAADITGSILDLPADYKVSLEATIGIYGTGLLDAIQDDDIIAEYERQQSIPGPVKGVHGPWITESYDGLPHLGKFTYSCIRATLQNGPGINALYNITNVTRKDRPYNYITPEWVDKMAELGLDTAGLLGVQKTELSQEALDDFMVWHRGLAVPAARNLDDPLVQLGKKEFYNAGCNSCHKPSWTTGEYHYMPGFSNQKIWPYTDLLKHDMGEINHGRFTHMRTSPLWGRGLMYISAGHTDMWHDLRARSFEEAILWHFGEGTFAREYFRNLDSEKRNALIKFLESI